MTEVVVRRESLLPVSAEVVWGAVTTAEGINHELRPWMTMSLPAGADALDIASVTPVWRHERIVGALFSHRHRQLQQRWPS